MKHFAGDLCFFHHLHRQVVCLALVCDRNNPFVGLLSAALGVEDGPVQNQLQIVDSLLFLLLENLVELLATHHLNHLRLVAKKLEIVSLFE